MNSFLCLHSDLEHGADVYTVQNAAYLLKTDLLRDCCSAGVRSGHLVLAKTVTF
jgi:hypothetical protein